MRSATFQKVRAPGGLRWRRPAATGPACRPAWRPAAGGTGQGRGWQRAQRGVAGYSGAGALPQGVVALGRLLPDCLAPARPPSLPFAPPKTQVLAAGQDYARETKALLLRANILQHDLVQRPPRAARAERPEREGRGGVMERLVMGGGLMAS